ncbi:hypothetical protein BKA69DRAFT_487974 [Paraphysoderma sedebokerense]|nr:hypothetical protein BKA69DRAFT_487974 [Paraphysoderma sedebokerense]
MNLAIGIPWQSARDSVIKVLTPFDYYLIGRNQASLMDPDMTSSVDLTDSQLLQLQNLQDLRCKTIRLLSLKKDILSKSEKLEEGTNVLNDLQSERRQLVEEKRTLLEMLYTVQKDLENITEAEKLLEGEKKKLQDEVTRLREEEYEPLIESINQRRVKLRLPPLPNLQEESDNQMAKYLEDRLEEWRDTKVSAGTSKIQSQPLSLRALLYADSEVGSSSMSTLSRTSGNSDPQRTDEGRANVTGKRRSRPGRRRN